MKLKPSALRYFKKHKVVSKIELRFVIWEIGLSRETVGTACQKDDENKLANSDSQQQLHWLQEIIARRRINCSTYDVCM